jgi:Leucine-rich repeat (LRR) protein
LRELILSENLIKSLPLRVFDKLRELYSLNLANNKMTTLNFANFVYNQQLVLLDVSSNQLTTLLASKRSLQLRTLLLDQNHLTNISVLQQLPQLTSLYVSGNELYDFGTVNFPALREIDISQNFWNCNYLDELLRNLRANNIFIMVRDTKTEVFNSRNVDRIGCSDVPPIINSDQGASDKNETVQTMTTNNLDLTRETNTKV